MATHKYDHPAPDVKDVSHAMRDVEKAHCCNLHFKLSVPVRDDTPVQMWVALHADPRIVGRKTIRSPVAVSHRWPSVDFKSLNGLMLALVYKLDRELDEFGHGPAEQAQFAWDAER